MSFPTNLVDAAIRKLESKGICFEIAASKTSTITFLFWFCTWLRSSQRAEHVRLPRGLRCVKFRMRAYCVDFLFFLLLDCVSETSELVFWIEGFNGLYRLLGMLTVAIIFHKILWFQNKIKKECVWVIFVFSEKTFQKFIAC